MAARRAPAQRLWGGWSSFKARAWTPRVDLLTPTGSTSRPVAWSNLRPGACQHSSLHGAGSALWTSAHGEVRGLLGACIWPLAAGQAVSQWCSTHSDSSLCRQQLAPIHEATPAGACLTACCSVFTIAPAVCASFPPVLQGALPGCGTRLLIHVLPEPVAAALQRPRHRNEVLAVAAAIRHDEQPHLLRARPHKLPSAQLPCLARLMHAVLALAGGGALGPAHVPLWRNRASLLDLLLPGQCP